MGIELALVIAAVALFLKGRGTAAPAPPQDNASHYPPSSSKKPDTTAGDVLATVGTVAGVAAPVITAIAGGTGGTAATTGTVAAATTGTTAGTAGTSTGATAGVSAGTSAATLTVTALSFGASLTVFAFAAIIQIAGIIGGPMIWQAATLKERQNKRQGRPRQELIDELAFGIAWGEQKRLAQLLDAAGASYVWTPGTVTKRFTNTITGESYDRAFPTAGGFHSVVGVSAEQLKELATVARFVAFEELWAYNTWNTRCAQGAFNIYTAANWSLAGFGLNDAELARVFADFTAWKPSGPSPDVQTMAATHADCAAWLQGNAARLGFDFGPWREKVRFTRVVQAIKQNAYSDYALNADYFYAAQAFGWPWVTIAGDALPWLVVPASDFALQPTPAGTDLAWQTLALINARQPWIPALPRKVA